MSSRLTLEGSSMVGCSKLDHYVDIAEAHCKNKEAVHCCKDMPVAHCTRKALVQVQVLDLVHSSQRYQREY